MGMFDNSQFNAPNVNAAIPSLQNFLEYKDNEQQKQLQFQKDLENFHSQLRLKEMAQGMDQQRIAKSREPLNVLPPTGLITPALDAQMQIQSDRNKLADENNDMRNRIAQQNANTKLKLGEEGLDTKKDIAGNTNKTREDITDKTLGSKATLQKEAEGAKEHLEGTKEANKVTNLNTRGNQMLNNIAAKGGQDRLTKATPSPNAASNNPSQQGIDVVNRANRFMNSDPLGKWVSIDPNTKQVVVAPVGSDGFFGAKGPTAAERQRILSTLYPNVTSGNSYGNPDTSITTQAPTGDKVRVQLPDGRIGYLPKGHPSLNDPRVKILSGGQ